MPNDARIAPAVSVRSEAGPRERAAEPPSLVALLRRRAALQPDRPAYIFLADGEREAVHLTYGALDLQARAIAAHLQAQGLAGERALLLYPQGLDYVAAFLGCLYAGTVAIPLYPPRLKDRSLARVQAVAADARAAAGLSTAATLGKLAPALAHVPELQGLRWVATDALPPGPAAEWTEPPLRAEQVAYLQYTSGSTSAPKGVMATHANLMVNLGAMQRVWALGPGDVSVSWCPLFHDMGLLLGVLLALVGGFPAVLLSPAAFLQRPLRWLEALSRFRGTFSPAPNFAFDLCVRKVPPEARAGLDLGAWRYAINAAEPVRAETMDRFAAAFGPCGFRPEAFHPSYGLAENTVAAAIGRGGAGPLRVPLRRDALEQHRVVEAAGPGEGARVAVGCGLPLPGHWIRIVDPEHRTPCAPDRVGEIWLAGPSVTPGYWNRPAETAETFGARLAGTGEGPYLRTGDLGFLRDGEVVITGRLKDLIIIRGGNHYPQDIELTAERSHPALRAGSGAAFPIEAGEEERLVIVQEVEFRQRPDPAEVAGCIRQAVAEEHGVQVHDVVLVHPGAVPKTSSGKIQRRACRAAYLAGQLDRWTPSVAPAAAAAGAAEAAGSPGGKGGRDA